MTQEFTPYANDEQNVVFTDSHGNELNFVNGVDSIAVYGQWQGSVQSDNFVQIQNLLHKISEHFNGKQALLDNEGQLTVSKKKEEILISADLDVTVNNFSLVLDFLKKSNKLVQKG